MKSVLKEYVVAQKDVMLKIVKDVNIAGNVCDSIKSDYDFDTFLQSVGLLTQEAKVFSSNLPKIVEVSMR